MDQGLQYAPPEPRTSVAGRGIDSGILAQGDVLGTEDAQFPSLLRKVWQPRRNDQLDSENWPFRGNKSSHEVSELVLELRMSLRFSTAPWSVCIRAQRC